MLSTPVAGSSVMPAGSGVTSVSATVTLPPGPAVAAAAPCVSLASRFSVPPLPNGALAVSFNASMIATVAAVLLLPPVPVPPLLSLVAPVVPVSVTATGDVLVPPVVPGVV